MKITGTSIVVLIMMIFVLSAFSADWMAPSKYGDKGHLVGGKTKWTYHEIDKKNSIAWKTEGPRSVEIFVRAPDEGEKIFAIYIDGDKYKEVKFKEKLSDKYTISIEETKPVPVTEAYTQKLRLGKGDHTVQVTSSQTLYVRMNNLTKKSKSIAPSAYEKSLSLITGDTKTTYYSASREKPVVFEYNGSGTLTVWTRLAFNESMKGTQHYTIVIENDEDTPRRMKLETVISETSTWSNDSGVIPGKARRFELKLGKGKHKLTFRPDDTTAPYCAIRFKMSA